MTVLSERGFVTALEAQPEPPEWTIRLRKEKEYRATTGLRAQPPAEKRDHDMPPLVRMQGALIVALRLEASNLLMSLRPLQLAARIEQERKGGVTSPSTDGRVSGTKEPKEPRLDARDRTLEVAEKDYVGALRKIIDAIDDCKNIEAGVLVPIHVATQKEARAASDLGVDCRDCHRPVACTPQDKLLTGMCEKCWKAWKRGGSQDIVGWLKQRQTQREAASS